MFTNLDGVRMLVLYPPEKTRTYYYATGEPLTLVDVVAYGAAPNDEAAHYLSTADGKDYIVAPGWRAVEINAPTPSFRFPE